MFGKKEIPVYLFTGFLESGKSTCIEEVIEEGNFSDGAKTLLILCCLLYTSPSPRDA